MNNLVAGAVRLESVMDRATPYHRPHSTQVSGYAVIYGGDDRFVGNVFLGNASEDAYAFGSAENRIVTYGTDGYDDHPSSFDEYLQRVNATLTGDHRRFIGIKQAVYIRDNVYAGAATPYRGEGGALRLDEAAFTVVEEGDHVYLEADVPASFGEKRIEAIDGRSLERVRFVDADFEERDGSPAAMDVDLVGEPKALGQAYVAGPVGALESGTSRTRVW